MRMYVHVCAAVLPRGGRGAAAARGHVCACTCTYAPQYSPVEGVVLRLHVGMYAHVRARMRRSTPPWRAWCCGCTWACMRMYVHVCAAVLPRGGRGAAAAR